MTNIDSPSYVLYNDSQLGAFSRERAYATRGIYACAEKALGYLMQSDLGTSTQLSARQVSSLHVKSALCTSSQLSARQLSSLHVNSALCTSARLSAPGG